LSLNGEGTEIDLMREEASSTPRSSADKRHARAEWWRKSIVRAFGDGEETLYYHPAILAAVEAVEQYTDQEQKVLVFGRFTRPMRALVDLLNARRMHTALERGEPWLQSRVHVQRQGEAKENDWPAVRAAHHQLKDRLQLGALDERALDRRLERQYNALERVRLRSREALAARLKEGLKEAVVDEETQKAFQAFERAVAQGEGEDLALLSRALLALTRTGPTTAADQAQPEELAAAFVSLLKSATDRDDPDADEDDDGEIDDDEADDLWDRLRDRIAEEYSRTQGSFARFMYGGTSPSARRLIQASFNRHGSYPAVLLSTIFKPARKQHVTLRKSLFFNLI